MARACGPRVSRDGKASGGVKNQGSSLPSEVRDNADAQEETAGRPRVRGRQTCMWLTRQVTSTDRAQEKPGLGHEGTTAGSDGTGRMGRSLQGSSHYGTVWRTTLPGTVPSQIPHTGQRTYTSQMPASEVPVQGQPRNGRHLFYSHRGCHASLGMELCSAQSIQLYSVTTITAQQ